MPEAKAITKREFLMSFSFLGILGLSSAILIWTVLGLDKRMEDAYSTLLIVASGLSFGIAVGSIAVIVRKLTMPEAKAITKEEILIAVSLIAILGLGSAILIQTVLGLDKRMEEAYRWMLVVAAGTSFGIAGGSIAVIVRNLFKCDD